MKIMYCKICGEAFGNYRIVNHLSAKHKIGPKQYYDTYFKKPGEGLCKVCGKPTNFISATQGYRTCCSRTCARKDSQKILDTALEWQCEECGIKIKEFSHQKYATQINSHIEKDHRMTVQEYYDKHLKKEGEGICRNCGKPTTFWSLFEGYRTVCSNECHIKQAKKDTEENKIEIDRLRKEEKEEKQREIREAKQEVKERKEEFNRQEDSRGPWIARGFEASPIYFQHFGTETDWS